MNRYKKIRSAPVYVCFSEEANPAPGVCRPLLYNAPKQAQEKVHMAITLKKGENLSLKKAAPNMVKIRVGLGWDARATDGSPFDLDASAFMAGASDRCRSDADFIFYTQLKSACGSVEHTGDNRTGAGDGDDETIKVDLSQGPAARHTHACTVH